MHKSNAKTRSKNWKKWLVLAYFCKSHNYQNWYQLTELFQKLIFLCWYLTDGVEGARILAVYPILAHSHFTYYEAIMTHLNSAGHEITFFSPFPATKTLQNFTMIDSRLQKSDNRSPCSRNFKNTYWLRWMYDTQEIHEKNCHEVAQLPEMKVKLYFFDS